ncbi:SDR family NAD(P)-dependent oxidoreductase [Pedobacter frigiditerrae]|uniref:SDR family NAD(P)-dependent oxidoreductase n=1 Tax=Pedobacter frigiditerrae TaxID=2530452 RepID=A0A4V2MHY6_9SPHI|nr:SDR family NAD(P)-dependent oxidoreductase [Pedobacter frigiditerrae]TCC88216.1 SDR family NAD(P)-dependent oxidoreductase [Pedobacter frigiditerrae]
MNKILIITGGSKGIGKGIIEAYLSEGYEVFSISRTSNKEFKDVTQIEFDLSKTDGIAALLTGVFENFKSTEVEKITLINNAGTLGQIGKIEAIADIEKTVQLNTVAPLILTSTFISLAKNWVCEKKIINISSGAAYKPYYGWSIYGATKAAIDMMTKTVAVEQDNVENGVKIIAIYPGVVDTAMQAQIRQSDKESFANIDRFLGLKATNSLANAATVGRQIFAIDQDSGIENGALIRVEE